MGRSSPLAAGRGGSPRRRLAAATAALVVLVSCQPPPSLEAPALSGVVEARSIKAASLVSGRVNAVHVEEGQEVAAGDLLVTLDGEPLRLQLAEQRSRLAEAEAKLRLLREGTRSEEIARARAAWAAAEATRRRLERLAREGIVAQQSLDDATAQAEERQQWLRQAEAGSRDQELRAAAAVVAQEEKRLAFFEVQERETRIVAPVSGVVERLAVRAGDVLEAEQPALEILSPQDLWLNAYLPEPWLGRVRIGQEVSVETDSFPGRSFSGRVASISSRAEYTPRNIQTRDERSDQLFRVRIELDPAPEIKAGMAATVRLARAVPPARNRPGR